MTLIKMIGERVGCVYEQKKKKKEKGLGPIGPTPYAKCPLGVMVQTHKFCLGGSMGSYGFLLFTIGSRRQHIDIISYM